MSTFFTSDWHIGDDQMELRSRPFQSVDDMLYTMVYYHNAVVNNDDIVYFLGDAVYSSDKKDLEKINLFNGKKILIRGNHDVKFSDEDFAPYFERIVSHGDGIYIDIDGILEKVYLTHYPSTGVVDNFNLVGHVHSAWKIQKNMINVGVDVNHFHPYSEKNIQFLYNAIKKYYDNDSFAAYLTVNETHRNSGVHSTYFKK